ncbi:hypothetical protein TW85_07520 [Marinomonas sp. S3726]|uniref:hypothetical protein n=1 Tax=Marinomonas sp. S3726 TaxID=579484 RepID=UPI0005FA7FD9|nr:hypothetical protein [Marinomonas sp. S3726]KJZ14925.1 hypothetical protein TW85_07520 [Marinomonas sp. S3726]
MELSKIHLDIMKDYHQRFGANSLQTLAAILVAIGWMLSVDQANVLNGIKPLCSVVVCIIWIIHIVVSFGIKCILIKQSRFINELGEIPRSAFEVYLINNWHFYLNLLMNSMLFTLLLLLIWQQHH